MDRGGRTARGHGQLPLRAGRRVACRVWIEQAHIEASGRAWENTFWINNSSGDVVQAHQMLAADDFPVATTLLKPAK
ncbi:Group 4 capsule polysaccharide lipoprotein GfcB|nr:Group 4 capsule polysaccharide lipoprotein GfcB [Candidatus Pantoea persica]